MDADVDLAFKYMGIDGIVKFPQREAAYKNTKSSDKILSNGSRTKIIFLYVCSRSCISGCEYLSRVLACCPCIPCTWPLFSSFMI
jgi:hypothetical protein